MPHHDLPPISPIEEPDRSNFEAQPPQPAAKRKYGRAALRAMLQRLTRSESHQDLIEPIRREPDTPTAEPQLAAREGADRHTVAVPQRSAFDLPAGARESRDEATPHIPNLDKIRQYLDQYQKGLDLADRIARLSEPIDMDELAPGVSHEQLAQSLLDSGQQGIDFLSGGIAHFRDLSPQIAEQLYQHGHSPDVLRGCRFGAFDDDNFDKQQLADQLIEDGRYSDLLDQADVFPPDMIDKQAIIDRAFDDQRTPTQELMYYKHHMPEADQNEFIKKLIDRDESSAGIVAMNLWQISSNHIDSSIASHLIQAGDIMGVLCQIDRFDGIDHQAIAEQACSAGYTQRLLGDLIHFPNGSLNVDLAEQLLATEHGYEVAYALRKFDDPDGKVAAQLLGQSITYLNEIPRAMQSQLKNSPAVRQVLAEHRDSDIQAILRSEDQGLLSSYAAIAGDDLPPAMLHARDVFGTVGVAGTRIANMILNAEAPTDYMKSLGITESGLAGIDQMKQQVSEFLAEFQAGDISPERAHQLEKSAILREALISVTGYRESTWGSSGGNELRQKIGYHNRAVEDGRIAPLKPGYAASTTYELTTVKAKKERVTWTQDATERYQLLYSDMQQAARMAGQRGGIRRAMEDLRQAIDGVADGITSQLEAIDANDPKADFKRQNLEQRLGKLTAYLQQVDDNEWVDGSRFVLESPADATRAFSELSPHKELHGQLRRLVFAWAMRKEPVHAEIARDLSPEPTLDSMSNMREFVEHIVNQETYGNYFSNKKQAGQFKQMNSTKALEEAMQRYQQQADRTGTTKLQFIPTRGLLMEMSGQIADACWADQYQSIAETLPNFTAVIMKARPGQANERVVGAGMLIETEDTATGEKVLLMRGLNPTENYIHKVDVGDFYQAATDYVRQQAQAIGAKPAIVIDNHIGGAATNRPTLFGYMSAERRELQRIPVPFEDTEFNGYNVSGDSYAL